MKKVHLVLISLSLLLSVATLAQDSSKKSDRIEKLKSSLNLSDAQAEEVKLLFQESRKEKKSISSNASLSKEEKKEQLKALKEAQENDLQAILSEDQYNQFLKLKEEKKEIRKQKREDFKADLNLTEKQEEQLKAIKADAKVKRDDIKSNEKLSETEKKDMLKTVRTETDRQIKSILSEEQYNKLQEAKKQRKGQRRSPKK